MLANEEWSYLPASRLGIAQEMVDDLAEVRRMLLSGDIASDDFNMSFVLNSCGSPSCIIGWATEVRLERQCRIADRKLVTKALASAIQAHQGLRHLCGFDCDLAHHATRAQAARAIYNFLTTGHAQWLEVLTMPTLKNTVSGSEALAAPSGWKRRFGTVCALLLHVRENSTVS